MSESRERYIKVVTNIWPQLYTHIHTPLVPCRNHIVVEQRRRKGHFIRLVYASTSIIQKKKHTHTHNLGVTASDIYIKSWLWLFCVAVFYEFMVPAVMKYQQRGRIFKGSIVKRVKHVSFVQLICPLYLHGCSCEPPPISLHPATIPRTVRNTNNTGPPVQTWW